MADRSLPEVEPELDVAHLKRLSVYVESDSKVPAETLVMRIVGYTAADQDETGGTAIPSGTWPESKIRNFMRDPNLTTRSLVPPTQLDFPIQRKCIIVLRLVGDFWRFRSREPLKTKVGHADNRYYNLRTYEVDGQVRGVIFYAKRPYRPNSDNTLVRHGINLYVDFVEAHYVLPVIIDPDIENKGRN